MYVNVIITHVAMYTLAGDQQVTVNVHLLSHVTNCVRNWNPSGAIVAFRD